MKKAVVSLAGLTAAFFIGVVSMMQGWGLEPKSWGWIIGCWFATVLVMGATGVVSDDD